MLNIQEPIEKRVFKNILLGILSFIITFLNAVISVPILLHFWGKETYGLWLSLFAGFSLLQTLDLGHQNYIGNKLNLLYHTDKDEFKKVLGSSLIIAYFIGALQILFGLYIFYAGLVGDFLGAEILKSEVVHVEIALMALLIMWFIFGSVSGIIIRILIPAGMMYQTQWLGILLRFSQFIALLLVAVLGGKILSAGIIIAIVQAGVTIFFLVYVKRKLPEFFPWWEVRNWKTSFNNFKYSLTLTVIIIVTQLGNNGIVLFIAKFFQSAVVPLYTTLRTITNTAMSATNIFMNAILPDIVKFHAKGEKEKLLISLDTHWFMSGAVVNIGIILMIPFVEKIYMFWTGGQLVFNLTLFLCLASGISFYNFGSGLITYLSGINDLTSQVIITSSRVLIIFITGYFLINKAGLTAIGIGILISEIISSVILSLFFVKLRLRKMNTKINLKSVITALIPPSIILLDILLLTLMNYDTVIVSIASLIFLLIIYSVNWFNLDVEVKERVKLMIKNFKFA